MKNDLFSIAGLTIHGYGLMIGIGFLAAYLLSDYRAKQKGLNPDHVFGLAVWGIGIGLVSAKLLYYITILDDIIRNPRILLDIANGFVVYGGIIGGIAGGYVYCRRHKLNFLKYADLIMPAVALAQGFGRSSYQTGLPNKYSGCVTLSLGFTSADSSNNVLNLYFK